MALDTELRRAGDVERQHSPPSPHRIEANGDDDDERVANRTLKFSIENILRPDFGKGALRKEDQTDDDEDGGEESRESSGSSGAVSTVNPAAREASSPAEKTKETASASSAKANFPKPMLWPAWVYCTRYSDRPSSGPRSRRMKKKEKKPEEKRPRTAFTNEQLARLKKEFQENRYLTEKRRQDLAKELKLNESQIKIWFQNKRAKIKKASGQRNSLALQLMAQGLYNHTTVPPNSDGKTFAVDE